jgi:outer membrane protein
MGFLCPYRNYLASHFPKRNNNERAKVVDLVLSFIIISTALPFTPALAYQAGDWLVRGRPLQVAPQDSSGNIYFNSGSGFNSIGDGVAVNNDMIP